MKPLVTIGIPTYKRLLYLKEAVASALDQTYENIEVLIGQDPGPEGPDKEIQEWSRFLTETNTKVGYYCNEQNLGLAGNWNAIANHAKGEYLIIIGDDDRLLPQCIEKLVEGILPGNNVAFANHYLIDSSGKVLYEDSLRNTIKFKRHNLKDGILSEPLSIIWQNSIPVSAALIKTEDVVRLKFKNDLNTPEIELFIRLGNEGGKFNFIPEYLTEYRIHINSETYKGLKLNRLLQYLIPLNTDEKVKPYKDSFIKSIISSAIFMSILEGNKKELRTYYFSSYYPLRSRLGIKGIFQFFCLLLPIKWSVFLLRKLHALKKRS